jgi:serine/threonine-protein kinase
VHDVLICLIVFSSITAWIALVKGRRGEGKRALPPPDDAARKELATFKQEKKLLEERVRNLESIVCSVDLELNGRLNRLALESRAAAPALSPTVAAKPVSPLPAFAPGKILAGRYHLERELGRGGMGAVFLARDAQLGELVALKIIHSLGGEDPGAIDRFRREASAARKITHPNVIRIYDLTEDAAAGELLLSMEYFPGMTLAELGRRRGALPVDEVRELVSQIADGLGAAHQAGVIHRDLKPGNVLINEQRLAKIIDFGLAKAPFMAGMTATGLIMGTPEYMAPEQIRGREVDARSDLYALGALAYQLATGVPPFGGDTPIAVGFAHCTQPVRPPRELRPDLPPALEAAICHALAKDPASRPQTAAELKREMVG